jgi:cystathionine beta-synthase
MGEVVGSLHEAAVMRLAFDDPAALDKPVSEVMGAPLPIIGSGEPVEDAVDLLEKGPAALVVDNGNPIGVLTRSDIVEYLAGETR